MVKVTVQFETEGNDQNEVVSHMDKSEVKLQNSEKNIVISHTHEILKQKNFTGSGFEGVPKFKSFFLETMFMTKLLQNYKTLEVPTRADFRPLILNLAVS